MENGRLAILDRRNRLICSIIRSFRHPMLREIEARKTHIEIPVVDPFRKIIFPTAIPKIKASFPEQTRVVVSEGIFDLLHDGHRTSLEHAKAQGDVLCVLVGTDTYARTKGEGRPCQIQTQRLS